MNEVNIFDCWYTIRERKKFLSRVRERTTIKSLMLKFEIMRKYVGYKYINDIPSMNIAYIPHGTGVEDIDFYGNKVYLYRKLHNVSFMISFDLKELSEFVLLSDANISYGNTMYEIIQRYLDNLRNELLSKYPKMNLYKKDFKIYHDDDVRNRVAQILSFYMTKKTGRMMRARRLNKIIELKQNEQ